MWAISKTITGVWEGSSSCGENVCTLIIKRTNSWAWWGLHSWSAAVSDQWSGELEAYGHREYFYSRSLSHHTWISLMQAWMLEHCTQKAKGHLLWLCAYVCKVVQGVWVCVCVYVFTIPSAIVLLATLVPSGYWQQLLYEWLCACVRLCECVCARACVPLGEAGSCTSSQHTSCTAALHTTHSVLLTGQSVRSLTCTSSFASHEESGV